MNCVAQSVARALTIDPADVYLGVGHGEPIHMSEIVAWLLTQGYAAVPQQQMTNLSEIGVIEGVNAQGNPHMAAFNDRQAITGITVIWYFIKVPVNSEYVRVHNENVRMGVCPERVVGWSCSRYGQQSARSCSTVDPSRVT